MSYGLQPPQDGAEQSINRLFTQHELKDAIVLIAKQFAVHITFIDKSGEQLKISAATESIHSRPRLDHQRTDMRR
jgi:hypothetical protein